MTKRSIVGAALLVVGAMSLPVPSASGATEVTWSAASVRNPSEVAAFASAVGISYDAAVDYYSVTHAVGELQRRGTAEFGSTFAGVWRDPSDGGLVHVAFAGQHATEDFLALTSGFPRSQLLRLHRAQRSLRDLQGIADRISADLGSWSAAELSVSTVAVDVVNGVVAVEVVREDFEEARSFAVARFGSAVEVKVGEAPVPTASFCTARAACYFEGRGGIQLNGPDQNYEICTAGFGAVNAHGEPMLLSAGHCFTYGDNIFHGAVPIGAVAGVSWPGGDASIINQNSLFAAPSNTVYWSETETNLTVRGVAGRTVTEAVGAPVCRTGVTTQNRCGTIRQLNVTVQFESGEVLYGMTLTNICALLGDSGGPFMSDSNAYGLTSAARDCGTFGSTYSYYYPAWRAENDLGVRINYVP